MEDRRARMESAGVCWFCGSCGDCGSCGTGSVIEQGRGKGKESALGSWDGQGKKRVAGSNMEPGRDKMTKVGCTRSLMPTLTSTFPASISPMAASSRNTDHALGQQCWDLSSQQYYFNSRPSGHDRLDRPVAIFNSQSDQMSFQIPIPPKSSSFQHPREAYACDGDIPVDPLLEHLHAKEMPKTEFRRPVPPYQESKSSPLPNFDTNWVSQCHLFHRSGTSNEKQVDLEINAMDNESFKNLLEGYGHPCESQSPTVETSISKCTSDIE